MKGLLKPLAAATIIGLTACGTEKTADEYLANAKQHIAFGDKNAAVIELKNALRQASDNLQARVLLGDIYYNKGSFEAAEKEYAVAYQNGADANNIIPKLALTYFNNSKSKEIQQLAADAAPSLSTESSATLFALQALSMIKQGQAERAREFLNIAENKQANNTYTRLARAALPILSGTEKELAQQREEALKTVDEVLFVAPKNIEANLLKGHFLMAKKQFELAEASYRRVTELAPEAPQYLLYLLQCLMKQGKYEQAEPALDKLLTVAQNHPAINEYKASILYSRRDFAGAQRHAQKAIQNGSANISSFVLAGISSLRMNQLEQAYRYLSQVQGNLPGDHLITRIYAYLQLQLGYTDEAIKTLDRLTNLKGSDVALFSSATAELNKSGDGEKALSYANKAASLDESGLSTVKLGVLKLGNDDPSGLEDLERALKDSPDLIEARLALVYGLLNQGEINLAQEAAEELIKASPSDPRGYNLKALVEKKLGNQAVALQLFNQALELAPNDAVVLLSKAALLVDQQKEPDAYQLHKQNIKHNADKIFVIHKFLSHATKYNRIVDATETINSQYESSESNVYLRWAYAAILASQNKQSQALELLSDLSDEHHLPATRQLLGTLQLQAGQLELAAKSYLKLLSVLPDSPIVYQRLVAIYELQNNYPEALKYTQQGLERFPNHQSFQLLEATMLFENKQFRAAKLSVEKLDEEAAVHPVALRLQARIAISEGEFAKSIRFWQAYYRKQPSMEALVSLATAYQFNKQPEQAIQLLEQDLVKYPRQYLAHLKLGEAYLLTEPKRAQAHYEAALKETPDNIIALNNIAWILTEEDQYSHAEEYAKKAYELSKQHPLISDTYGLCLLRQGKINEAVAILESAYEEQSNNIELALHYSEALIEKGNKSRASSILAITSPKTEEFKQQKLKLMAKL